jgi:hypothetical protein
MMTNKKEAAAHAMRYADRCSHRQSLCFIIITSGFLLLAACENPAPDAGLGVDEGVVDPTSAGFGTVPGDEQTLYVLNDGGLSNPLPAQELHPNIVKLTTNISRDPIIKGR